MLKKSHTGIIRWLIRAGGTVLLLLFLWRFGKLDFQQVGAELAQANYWLVGLALLLIFPLILGKTLRWQVLLHGLGLQLPLALSYRLYAWGMAIGSYTPGQLGDMWKAFYLRQKGYGLGTALLSSILDRLFDVAALALLAATGLAALGNKFNTIWPGLVSLLVGVSLALLALWLPGIRTRLLGLALKLLRKKTDPLEPAPNQVQATSFIASFGLTMLATAIALSRVWLMALAVDLDLGIWQLIAVSSLSSVAVLLPISIGGVGVRDLTLVGILGVLGYSNEKALALSTLLLILQLVNIPVGWLIWWRGNRG